MSVRLIARREITENILTFRNLTTTLFCLVLFATGVVLMAKDYETRLMNYQLRDTEGRLYFGNRVKLSKKPTPLSILVRGLEPDTARLLLIWDAQPRNQPGGQVLDSGERNALLALFPVPDFAFLAKTVLSLLALFFSFDAICGEKEKGTLRLMLANRVSRSEVLIGKWMGGYGSLLLCVLPGIAAMLLTLNLSSSISLGSEDWLRIGCILILTLLYLSLFFFLGLFISTRTHRADTALILILLVWLVWVVATPNVSAHFVERTHPIPTADEVAAKKQRLYQQETRQRTEAMLTTGMGVREARVEARRWADEQCWQLNDEALRTVHHQMRLTQNLSRLSPLGSFMAAVTTMARTGVEDTHHYKSQVIHWDKQRRQQAGLAFEPTELRFEDGIRAIAVDCILLVLLNVVFLLGTYLSFLRYDVR